MNPPSIQEQIETLQSQIRDIRASHADAEGRIDDAKALRDIEAMECTVSLLKRWSE